MNGKCYLIDLIFDDDIVSLSSLHVIVECCEGLSESSPVNKRKKNHCSFNILKRMLRIFEACEDI